MSPPRVGWESYAHGSAVDHFAWWCERTCVQSVDRFAGKPLVLEPWQLEVMGEALAVDDRDLPYWRVVVILLPRKNGKSSLLGAYALYHLAEYGFLGPEILLAASSDEQAGRLFDAATGFIRRSSLVDRMHLREYIGQVARVDGLGTMRRMANDYRRLHGYNPSLVVADELHAWTTVGMRKAWEALTSGDGAREWRQVFAITTHGEAASRGDSILGLMVDGAAEAGEVEERPGLRVIRHHGAHLLVFEFTAPPEADPRPLRAARAAWRSAVDEHGAGSREALDAQAVVEEWRLVVGGAAKLANPASWVTAEDLADKAESPKLTPSSFLQLHAGVWSDGVDPFITMEEWARLGDGDHEIPPVGVRVMVGVDGSYTLDTTAVAWAAASGDGRVDVGARVFSAVRDAPHHVMCHGGHIDFSLVEDLVVDLTPSEVVYDPRYMVRSSQIIDARLPSALIAPVEPQSALMREALAAFHRGVSEGVVRHNGDRVIAAHIAATRGEFDADRGWRVRKRDATRPIDAVIAISLAYWRVARSVNAPRPRVGRL